jgi:hypothetical protein
MESRKYSLSLNSLYFGLGLGIALIVFDLMFYIFNAPVKSPFKYLNIVIILGFIVYGTYVFRNKHNNGLISYGRSFLSCFLIALYGGIVYAIYMYIFLKFFDKTMLIQITELARQQIAEKMPNLNDDQIEEMIQMQSKFMTPLFISFGTVFNMTFWGAVLSLIVSVFLKKEDKSFNGTFKDFKNESEN